MAPGFEKYLKSRDWGSATFLHNLGLKKREKRAGPVNGPVLEREVSSAWGEKRLGVTLSVKRVWSSERPLKRDGTFQCLRTHPLRRRKGTALAVPSGWENEPFPAGKKAEAVFR